jgi:hypothetical protein
MPANYKVKNVQFKTKAEGRKHSTWSAHLDGCAREVTRVLELLAKNNDDRWVYITVPKLTKLCNGRFRSGKDKGKPYSQFTVEQALRFLRENNLISHKLGIAPDGRTQNGFIVAPHGSLTRRSSRACNFVGLKNATGIFVIRNGGAAWLQNPEADTGDSFGLIQETEDTAPDTAPHTVPSTERATVGATDQPTDQASSQATEGATDRATDQHGIGYGAENPELIENTEDEPALYDDRSRENKPQPPQPREPFEPGEPPQPLPKAAEVCGWLSSIWNHFEENRGYDEKVGPLRFRRARLADKPSPDVTAIENLITAEKNQLLVQLAWIEFCMEFPHDKETKFPITVFSTPENFASMRDCAKAAVKQWHKQGKQGKPPAVIDYALYFKEQSK